MATPSDCKNMLINSNEETDGLLRFLGAPLNGGGRGSRGRFVRL